MYSGDGRLVAVAMERPRNGVSPRHLSLHPGEQYEALKTARTRLSSEAGKARYKRRASFWAPAHPVSGRTENALTFKGEVKEDKTTEDKHDHRREFHHGAFAWTIALTTTVHAEKATASDLTAGNA
jgi:hypothetical protein